MREHRPAYRRGVLQRADRHDAADLALRPCCKSMQRVYRGTFYTNVPDGKAHLAREQHDDGRCQTRCRGLCKVRAACGARRARARACATALRSLWRVDDGDVTADRVDDAMAENPEASSDAQL